MSDNAVPEGIDAPSVTAWFGQHVPAAEAPLQFELIAGGHSNLTYRVQDSSGASFVLRRPPLGHVLATAHDMAREHRIVSAVGTTDVPVPRTIGVTEDAEVNGAPFYVMDYVDGEVLHGDKRGRALGFPTVNIVPVAGMMIPHGVYITEIVVEGTSWPGITNVGIRPTVTDGEATPNAETFILAGLDPEATLYGRRAEVRLRRFVRPEQKFEGLDALKAQIGRDVADAQGAEEAGRERRPHRDQQHALHGGGEERGVPVQVQDRGARPQ